MGMNINFDDGIKEISINGDENRILRVNVTDLGLIDRVDTSIKHLEREMEKLDSEKIKLSSDGEAQDGMSEVAEQIRKLNKLFRDEFDNVFYPGSSEIVFGNQNPLSISDGKTIFENFMVAFAKYIKPFIEEESKKTKKNIDKYRRLYKKKS